MTPKQRNLLKKFDDLKGYIIAEDHNICSLRDDLRGVMKLYCVESPDITDDVAKYISLRISESGNTSVFPENDHTVAVVRQMEKDLEQMKNEFYVKDVEIQLCT